MLTYKYIKYIYLNIEIKNCIPYRFGDCVIMKLTRGALVMANHKICKILFYKTTKVKE